MSAARIVTESTAIAGASIDGLEFAREGRRLAGQVAVTALSRLAEVLVGDAGALDCEIAGERDRDGKAWLTMALSGSLNLRCQRCLAALVFPVDISSRFLLIPQGQPWPDEDLAEDGFDAIAAEKEMALLPLIEDEVLLALPIAPRHESCEPPAPVIEENEPSPFAALARLRRSIGEG